MIKKITALILSLSLSLCSTATFSFADNKDRKEDTLYEHMMKQKESPIIKLEDLSIEELTKLRDEALDENLSMSSYDMSDSKEAILDPNWDFGLVGFLNKNYSELTEKENLIKQIQLIEYATLYNDVLDPSGEVFKMLNEDYQISEYLINHGKTYEISTQENLEFLIENIEDLVEYVDFDAKTVVEIIDPTIKDFFISNDEIKDLNEQLEEKALDEDLDNTIKENIQSFVDETQDLDELSIDNDSDSEKLPRATTFTSSVLAYAKKHGYTNGYYGSSNSKNNAPSPYYNFQKDGAGDCANFVSQCLKAGGKSFTKSGDYPWYYYSLSNRSNAWCYARYFKLHWMRRVSYKTMTVSGTLSYLKPATPVSICNNAEGRATHTLITTDKHSNGYNFSYAAHSDYGARTNLLKKLDGKKISYYKVNW